MGFGVETSSHRHGLFQHATKALEVVLPDSTLKLTTPDLNLVTRTLGFLVAAEIEVWFHDSLDITHVLKQKH